MAKLDGYSMMIVSTYFEDFDELYNTTLVCKKFGDLFKKFHYNPFPLTNKTRPFFTNLQTLYLYFPGDNAFEKEDFYKRLIVYEVDYTTSTYKEGKREYNNITTQRDAQK
ncbi:hypothetical protein EIN_087720 [Entamoeba invadens IP1]|uniref:hypothetical protein n=1 Tax=Entamoeba invadens IP1 TaxID=370355 RepID=UPI0002C3E5D2|nr:hypothetical protein EIN_087720 [Entamoeba invadens IP1]ELP85450.1 hypothetical protein EIN_087720 [Entamoeba invadens IP1]|eukprot:XP_004184796.1 hypothetical protein EIN_087720 [Entamoeba invadens IP1]